MINYITEENYRSATELIRTLENPHVYKLKEKHFPT